MSSAEDVRESVRESRYGLNRRERELSNVVLRLEAKDALNLRVVDVLLDADHVRVHVANVVDIAEDESLLGVETEREDILDIVASHLVRALGTIKVDLRFVNVLLVVSDLDDKGHVKNALEPLSEDEGHAMAHVESVS